MPDLSGVPEHTGDKHESRIWPATQRVLPGQRKCRRSRNIRRVRLGTHNVPARIHSAGRAEKGAGWKTLFLRKEFRHGRNLRRSAHVAIEHIITLNARSTGADNPLNALRAGNSDSACHNLAPTDADVHSYCDRRSDPHHSHAGRNNRGHLCSGQPSVFYTLRFIPCRLRVL